MKNQLADAAVQCDILAHCHRSMAASLYAKARWLERKAGVKKSSIRAAAKSHLIKATRLSRHYDRLMEHYRHY